MKLFKGFLHYLITLISTFAFLAGWVTLAHSLKPAQPVQQQELAALDPLPPVGFVNNASQSDVLQQFVTPRTRSRSFFVTRGS